MAAILKGFVCGDQKVGKTSFLETLSGEKLHLRHYEVELTDPASQAKIKFWLEDSDEFDLKTRPICAFLVYSLEDGKSFEAVKHKWLPWVQNTLTPGSSFIIIIGTHSDSLYKQVDSHEAEEFAASSGAFHLEISNTTRRNIELTLKLMRIRAFYLLKKHPELEESEDDQLIPSPKTTMNTSNSFNLDIPLPYKDYNNIQSRKHRYEEAERKSFAESVFESSGDKQKLAVNDEKDVSFADLGDSDENPNYSDDSLEENFQEISIDTLGSPSWHQKVPPLSVIHVPTGNYPQTERSHEPSSRFLESGSSTERGHKQPLMLIEVLVDSGVKKVEVFEDDSALSIAERAIGRDYACREIESLAEIVEQAVNDYLGQIRNVGVKKPLYKVKIAIGNKWGEIVVHEGDSLEEIAEAYVSENKLPKQYTKQILKLLVEAGEKNRN